MEWIQLRYGKYQSKISWRSFKVSMKKLPVSGFYAYTILWLDSKAPQKGPSVLAHQTTHAEIGSKAVFFFPSRAVGPFSWHKLKKLLNASLSSRTIKR